MSTLPCGTHLLAQTNGLRLRLALAGCWRAVQVTTFAFRPISPALGGGLRSMEGKDKAIEGKVGMNRFHRRRIPIDVDSEVNSRFFLPLRL
uniref:Secreted protein n=1 Tax=Panagrellus redivivus TaxID=6233 RepID=A0A7E4ZTV2_PANRE